MNILLLKISMKALCSGHHRVGYWLAWWPYTWQMKVHRYSKKLNQAVSHHYMEK